MWGKKTTKTCALLRALWKGSFPLIQNCPATPGSSGRLLGGRAAPGRFTMDLLRQHRDKSKGIAFLGFFRREEGAGTACSWCCGFAGLPPAELQQWTPTTSRPSRSSSAPGPAPAKSEPPKTTNQLRELPAAFPCWMGQQMGAGCRIPQGHLQTSQKEN